MELQKDKVLRYYFKKKITTLKYYYNMIINVANFNFGGDSGGGGKPALLQEKTATIVQNGSQTITPDEGFDGMSSVQINAAITGASSAIDFSSIGYDAEFSAELNANFNNNVAYSKTLYDAWNPSNTSARNLYSDDTKIVYAPNINTSNVNNMGNMLQGCTSLTTVPLYNTSKVNDMYQMFSGCSNLKTVPAFNTSNVTNFGSMFAMCSSLTSVPSFDTSKATSMYHLFYGCSNLTTIPAFDTSKVNSMEKMFYDCNSLKTIECISFKSFSDSTMDDYYLCGYGWNSSIRKAVFKDIGYQSTAVQFNASYITNWGVNSDEIPDARQSLIDSLITYSFDRSAAGYPTCTITLSDNTKALLTADEIAQITAKGFTIA